MKKTALIILVAAILSVAAFSAVLAQSKPDPAAAATAAPAEPAPAIPQIMTQPVASISGQQPACSPTITTTALSADTFVSVKDQGDSQTVLIYKVDDQGNVRLTSKKKYMY
jgi:Flp pilus assembly protein CpaB